MSNLPRHYYNYLDTPPKLFLRDFAYSRRNKSRDAQRIAAYKFTTYTTHMELLYMPKKSARKTDQSFADYWFVNCRLDGQGKEAFTKWMNENTEDFDVLWGTCLQYGWKQTLTFDSDNDCFIASLTCRKEDSDNYGAVITSRSGYAYEALMLSLYKLFVIFRDTKITKTNTGDNWG